MPPENIIDYDEHWTQSLETYRSHPTSRHRRRFVLRALRTIALPSSAFVFDYGCGPGILLRDLREAYRLSNHQLGGCDTSEPAVAMARSHIPSPHFHVGELPELERPIDVAIATEVIEHTERYREILEWLGSNLRREGTLILTTPGGRMDPPDVYYGHTQHFVLEDLKGELEAIGFSLTTARYWGFPLFSLQKWITAKLFDNIKENYMSGSMNAKKAFIFSLAYYSYFLHDILPAGPQIFIRATKTR